MTAITTSIKQFLEPDRLKALNDARTDERGKTEKKCKFESDIELARVHAYYKNIIQERDSEIKSQGERVKELEADKRDFQDRKDKLHEMVVAHKMFMTELFSHTKSWLEDQTDKARKFYTLKDKIEGIDEALKKIAEG